MAEANRSNLNPENIIIGGSLVCLSVQAVSSRLRHTHCRCERKERDLSTYVFDWRRRRMTTTRTKEI